MNQPLLTLKSVIIFNLMLISFFLNTARADSQLFTSEFTKTTDEPVTFSLSHSTAFDHHGGGALPNPLNKGINKDEYIYSGDETASIDYTFNKGGLHATIKGYCTLDGGRHCWAELDLPDWITDNGSGSWGGKNYVLKLTIH